MIYNNTDTVYHDEEGEQAFIFDETPTLSVLQPDGTYLLPPNGPTVSVSPGTSALKQRLSATFQWSQAGVYMLTWKINQGANDLQNRPELYFCAWTDVYDVIRTELQATDETLSDKVIDYALVYMSANLINQFSTCFASYNAITSPSDRMFFDLGLAYMAAEALKGIAPSTTPAGDLIEVQIGTDRYKYKAPPSPLGPAVSPAESLINKAYNSLRLISCIAAELDTIASGAPLMVAAGPRRTARQSLGLTVDNPLYEMFYDALREMNWSGRDGA